MARATEHVVSRPCYLIVVSGADPFLAAPQSSDPPGLDIPASARGSRSGGADLRHRIPTVPRPARSRHHALRSPGAVRQRAPTAAPPDRAPRDLRGRAALRRPPGAGRLLPRRHHAPRGGHDHSGADHHGGAGGIGDSTRARRRPAADQRRPRLIFVRCSPLVASARCSGIPGTGWNPAGVELRGRPVFDSDAGRIEIRRFAARQWQTRADQAVGPATVIRISAIASMVVATAAAITPCSTPVAKRFADSGVRSTPSGSSQQVPA